MALDLKSSIVVFDTSSLLNLYLYNDVSIQAILNKMSVDFKDRLYTTDFSHIEFLRNYKDKLFNPLALYDQLVTKNKDSNDSGYINKIQEGIVAMEKAVEKLHDYTKNSEKHPFLTGANIGALSNAIKVAKTQIDLEIAKVTTQINDQKKLISARKDYIKDWIDQNIKLGRKFSFSELQRISQDAHQMFLMEFPPGYKDQKDKVGIRKYADYIIWKQFLEIIATNKKPGILVIDDLKEDWCYKKPNDSRQIDYPREELSYEFSEATGFELEMLTMSQFLFEVDRHFQYKTNAELFKPDKISNKEISTINFKADNARLDFGITHRYEGRFDVFKDNIICKLNQVKFINNKDIQFKLISLILGIGYKQDDGRWNIAQRSERLNLNMDLVPNGEVDVINVDLEVSIPEAFQTQQYWIVFELESQPIDQPYRGIGTTYTHWDGIRK